MSDNVREKLNKAWSIAHTKRRRATSGSIDGFTPPDDFGDIADAIHEALALLDAEERKPIRQGASPDLESAVEYLDEARRLLGEPADENDIYPAQEPLEHAVAALTLGQGEPSPIGEDHCTCDDEHGIAYCPRHAHQATEDDFPTDDAVGEPSEPVQYSVGEAMKALRCLYIAVEKDIADDVNEKVRAAFRALAHPSGEQMERDHEAMEKHIIALEQDAKLPADEYSYRVGFDEGFTMAHENAPCGHARANLKDPNFGTPEYDGDERCEFCAALSPPPTPERVLKARKGI